MYVSEHSKQVQATVGSHGSVGMLDIFFWISILSYELQKVGRA